MRPASPSEILAGMNILRAGSVYAVRDTVCVEMPSDCGYILFEHEERTLERLGWIKTHNGRHPTWTHSARDTREDSHPEHEAARRAHEDQFGPVPGPYIAGTVPPRACVEGHIAAGPDLAQGLPIIEPDACLSRCRATPLPAYVSPYPPNRGGWFCITNTGPGPGGSLSVEGGGPTGRDAAEIIAALSAAGALPWGPRLARPIPRPIPDPATASTSPPGPPEVASDDPVQAPRSESPQES